MDTRDVLRACDVKIGLRADGKRDALRQMCELLKENGRIASASEFLSDVLRREEMGPTGIGDGIAIPHGQSASVLRSAIAVGKLASEIAWETHDGSGAVGVVILFAVQGGEDFSRTHLRLLADIARRLARREVLDALLAATTPDQVVESLTS